MANDSLLGANAKKDQANARSISPAEIEAAVYRAADSVNELLADTQQLEKNRETALLETGTVLDSLAVINLLVFVEDEINAAFGRRITLAGEDNSGNLDATSLKTVGTLIDALHTLLEESP